ncbi:hypothetical protein GH714_015654 [Hevea brasiliensis]|uniref:Protein TIC 20 n=1 Tax=Hevea brasiliensis TaxID=3981 RepID=A0A6A6NHI1_HEVBR|nr:hypothetical protein GH714_015654 [Hevea brasiliensis]
MILNGYTMPPVARCAFTNTRACKPMPSSLISACVPPLTSKAAFLNIRSSWLSVPDLDSKSWSYRDFFNNRFAILAPFCCINPALKWGSRRNLAHNSLITKEAKIICVPSSIQRCPIQFSLPSYDQEAKMVVEDFSMSPYLMPLHETWMYAETAYHLHPFLEDFEFLTYPFLGAIGRLPSWFLMAYFFVAYLGIVRRKEWPHFFRFHVVMGMLLEIALQVIGTMSRWMPLAFYWGKVGMHFWTAIAFAYLFTVLECIRCALAGMYADVPFACDAAYIQIPYD